MQQIAQSVAGQIASAEKIDCGVLGREKRGGRGGPVAHHQNAAMRGVDRKEQSVMQRELSGRTRANGVEEQCRVGAVRMPIDQLPPRLDRARIAGTAVEGEMLIGVALDGGLMAMHFPPGEPAVAVILELQHEIEVTQGVVPLADRKSTRLNS